MQNQTPMPDSNGGFAQPVHGALWMAAQGIPQMPLKPKEKVPLLPEWEKIATTDPEKILSWSTSNPNCNFGSVFNGGVFAFEADLPKGNTPRISERFKQAGKRFSPTLTVSSSPGKGHRYFKLVPEVRAITQNDTKYGDFSVRVGNMFCVSPGSIHPSGGMYVVVGNNPIVPPTADEIAFWESEKKSSTKPSVSNDGPVIPYGSHDTELTRIAGVLRNAGMNIEKIEEHLIDVCEKRCEGHGSDFREMCKKIARSIGSKPVSVATTLLLNGVVQNQGAVTTAPVIDVRPMETQNINESESSVNSLDYLPSTTLASTRLQDIFVDFADNDWPLTLALPALVTAASVVVPPMPRTNGLVVGDDSMVNLYTALIASSNAGKTQVANWAATAVGIFDPPVGQHYFEGKWGSAEQMLRSLQRKQSVFTSKAVLITPDEWAHLFSKAAIPDASFPTVLTTSFYRRNQIFTLGGSDGGKEYQLNLAMSFIGGIVEDQFDTVFGANSIGGLYDRFLFGRAPDNFKWSYRPCPFEQKRHWAEWDMKPVRIDDSVYEVLKSWTKENPRIGRVAEICSRIAVIYASLDGRSIITGKDIEPLKDLALYQVGLRQVFRPNPGQSPDAIYANTALAWVNKHGAAWVSISALKKGLYRLEEKLGPVVAMRSLLGLAKSGRVDLWLPGDFDRPMPVDYTGPKVRVGLVRRVN